MEAQRRAARKQAKVGHEPAMVRFRHDATGSGISRHGHIRPGAALVVEYDPARLPPSPDVPSAASEIVCHVRFQPGGQEHSGPVGHGEGGLAAGGAAGHGSFAVSVPRDAVVVELWFERRGSDMTIGWDSRYGQNYSLPVVSKGLPIPEPSVAQLSEAAVDNERIRVLEDAASKEESVVGTAARRVHTGLSIRALVKVVGADPSVWADIHVFDGADELVHAGTVILLPREARRKGTVFGWDDDVYQGSGGGSGMGVWLRPDAHTVQYRLYCRAAATPPGTDEPEQIFTDGVLHQFEVPSDEDVSGVAGESSA